MNLRFLSPLRYPGGKGLLGDFVGQVMGSCHPRPTCYVEPFAGGAGVALRLLVGEYVERVILNDLDPGIAAFWRAVFCQTSELVDLVHNEAVSIERWHHHRAVYQDQVGSDLELGFATFFLNRTNRSGILNARPIGGLEQQGSWKIDARFNRDNLAERVRFIGEYRDRVHLREEPAAQLLESLEAQWGELFVYADPPYLDKGGELYLNDMAWEDHAELAVILRRLGGRWMVTYDQDPRVHDTLYPDYRCAEYGIAHTAAKQHMGSEFAVFSNDVVIDNMIGVGSGSARWLKSTIKAG